MTSGALALFRRPRHRRRRPSLELVLVDWWVRASLPFLWPTEPGPAPTCSGCLAVPRATRRGDEGRLSCQVCARPARRRHAITGAVILP